MRIVHVEAGRNLYGGAAQVRDLVAGLQAAGHDNVLIAAAGGRLAALSPDALAGARIVPLPIRGDLDLSLPARLKRAFAALEPDIVHVHSRRGADLAGAIACALDDRAAVLTRRVESREPGFWLRAKCAPYGRVIAISRAVEAELERAGVERERVVRVPSAVDPSRFAPDARARRRVLRAFALPEDALAIGVAAQLIPRKGHSLLFACLPELVRRYPNARVLCFGQGPLAARLKREVATAGLAEHVRFAGFRDDLPELLPGLDLLVHPAEREGLGLAVLEAMSAGVAVVACAAGGVPDAIEHGVNGLLVPPRDRARLSRALELACADAALRERLGQAGRERVLAEFSPAALVDAHIEIYRKLLGERAAAGVAHGAV